jgi:hypothetical protein
LESPERVQTVGSGKNLYIELMREFYRSHASAWEPENSVLSTVQNKFWTHKSKFLDGLAERNLYIYKSPSSADFEIRGKILVYNKNNTLPASMNLTY